MMDEEKLRHRMQRIADLVQRLDSVADPAVKAQSRELMECVMDLHGEALERVMQCIRQSGELGRPVTEALSADAVVTSVLLLYGLHPVDFETRVRQAVEKVQPALRQQGADAELTGMSGGAVRILIRGVDSEFAARTVRSALEDELYAAAPDATSLILQGLECFPAAGFVSLG
jgi:hypothetical protein